MLPSAEVEYRSCGSGEVKIHNFGNKTSTIIRRQGVERIIADLRQKHPGILSRNNCYSLYLDQDRKKINANRNIEGNTPNFQYPYCQHCKLHESRFVCAGCGNQWYCSKKCQISAWDKHSEICTD